MTYHVLTAVYFLCALSRFPWRKSDPFPLLLSFSSLQSVGPVQEKLQVQASDDSYTRYVARDDTARSKRAVRRTDESSFDRQSVRQTEVASCKFYNKLCILDL